MKNIKVLGSGCTNCRTTAALIEEVTEQLNLTVQIDKVQDIRKIMEYGVMSTPAVVIDEQVVHKGSVPTRDTVLSWFS